MKRWRGTALILCMALLTAGLGGCGTREAGGPGDSGQISFEGMEPEPVFDYETPESKPGILTDRAGYQAGAEKTAVMKGRRLPNSFRLVDSATGQTVYSGNIEKLTYVEEQDLYTGYGDFSAYDMEGEYYLECDIIGRSYPFVIGKDLYRSRFEQVLNGVAAELEAADAPDSRQEREALLMQTSILLLSYELSPEMYEDMDGNGIPEALDLAAGQVGKLRAWRDGSGSTPESALYPAVLAKFSYLYQKFDKNYAAECLKDAAGVFDRQMNTGGAQASSASGLVADSEEDGRVFWALAELYRAAGKQEYRWRLREYREFFEGISELPKEQEYLFGAMTYLCTRQRVEKELCDDLMELLLQEGERIEEESDSLLSPFAGTAAETEELLEKAVVLSLANYVLVNYKYDMTLEETGHYLAGQNPNAQSRYPFSESGGADGGMDTTQQTRYLLLLAQLAKLYGGSQD